MYILYIIKNNTYIYIYTYIIYVLYIYILYIHNIYLNIYKYIFTYTKGNHRTKSFVFEVMDFRHAIPRLAANRGVISDLLGKTLVA